MINGKMFIPLTDLQNGNPAANAAGLPYYDIPQDYRIHLAVILMQLPAGKKVADVVDRLQLKLGTNLQRDLQPNYWDDLLTIDGPQYGFKGDQPGSLVYVPFQFTEPVRETPIPKENYALDMPLGLTGAFQVKLKANAAHPTIVRAFMVAEPLAGIPVGARNLDRGLPVLAKYRQTDINPGGTTADLDTQIQALRVGRLMHMSLYDPLTTGKITEVDLKLDSVQKWSTFKADNDYILEYFSQTARAGVMSLVPDLMDKQNDAWDLGAANKFQLKITADAAMTGGMTVVTKSWERME